MDTTCNSRQWLNSDEPNKFIIFSKIEICHFICYKQILNIDYFTNNINIPEM